MRTFKRIAAIASTSALMLGLTGGPALAAAPPASCTNSSLCGYVDSSFRTREGYSLMPARSAGTCENLAARNQWSSIYNNSGRTVRMHKNLNCGGDGLTFTNGQNSTDMWLTHPTFNDNIESVRWQ